MYEEYFSLNEIPFSTSPDPRFFFLTPQHKESLAKIKYAIDNDLGLTIVYGDIGTGKTTVARRVHQQYIDDDKTKVVLMVQPNYSTPTQFLRAIATEFGIKTARDKLTLFNLFRDYLIDQVLEKGNTLVLLIDEAQTLKGPLLELVRELLNVETNDKKLLNIVLFGQEELGVKLANKPNVASRVALYGRLNPLSPTEAKDMLKFRWNIAGGKELPFDEQALDTLFKYSKGLPREMNTIANVSLITAVSRKLKTVNKSIIDEVAKERGLVNESPTPTTKKKKRKTKK